MNTAFLFPGQGAQVPGMLHHLPDHPAVRDTLAEAGAILKKNPLTLDTAEALLSTVQVQLALLISGVAAARALMAKGTQPAAVAGMSAGAFSAAVISGSLKFADALRLVQLRAEGMAGLYPHGYGLSIIIGLTEGQVLDITKQVASAEHPLYLSNINAPRQIGIAGSVTAMEKALALARDRGASKAIRLEVAVPSHCPLLEPVAESLRTVLGGMSLEEPKIVYIGNMSGRALRSAKAIAEDLAGNVAHAIRWHDGSAVLEELGCGSFIEMPPGHVLTDLARETFKEVKCVAVSQTSLEYAAKLAVG